MVSVGKPFTAVATAAFGTLARNPRLRRQVRATGDVVARQLRRRAGGWQGARYRLAGRSPDPDVDDATLADRVRSSIGPVLKRLDLPQIHVMSEDHVVLLHGEVGDLADARAVEAAVRRVSGVAGVESYLHIGLLRSDTRPSTGHAEPSDQHRRLRAAAWSAGVHPVHADAVTRAVLGAFTDALPAGERTHVLTHLSPDVRALAGPPRRHGRRARVRTAEQLVGDVARIAGISLETAERAAQAVLHELKPMLRDEQADVLAVLPPGLRELWARGPHT